MTGPALIINWPDFLAINDKCRKVLDITSAFRSYKWSHTNENTLSFKQSKILRNIWIKCWCSYEVKLSLFIYIIEIWLYWLSYVWSCQTMCVPWPGADRLTLLLLLANFVNTKWCNKLRNNWNLGIWVLIWEYSAIQWIPTWQGLGGFQRSSHPCVLEENRFSIGRVNEMYA